VAAVASARGASAAIAPAAMPGTLARLPTEYTARTGTIEGISTSS
jgi:hypothetical protein